MDENEAIIAQQRKRIQHLVLLTPLLKIQVTNENNLLDGIFQVAIHPQMLFQQLIKILLIRYMLTGQLVHLKTELIAMTPTVI